MTAEKPHFLRIQYPLRANERHLRANLLRKWGFFSSHIIAILAAILFPVFAKAREKARQSSCLSNVKQIMLGVLQYSQDYDECLPFAQMEYPAPIGNVYILANILNATNPSHLMPYLKNSQIAICPSLRGVVGYGWGHSHQPYRSGTAPTAYSPVALAAYNYPAEQLLFICLLYTSPSPRD